MPISAKKMLYLITFCQSLYKTETAFDGENDSGFCSQVHKVQKIPLVADVECRCLPKIPFYLLPQLMVMVMMALS